MWTAIKNFFSKLFGQPKPAIAQQPEPQPLPPQVETVTPYKIAIQELTKNISEIAGSKHNPRIVEYHSHTTLKATTDEIPWCASFICFCVEKSGRKSTKSAAARSYLTFGKHVDIKDAQPGDIVVFTRTGGHHVAFFERWAADGNLYVLGGNQNNSVCVSKYNKANLIGVRRVG